jgi:hypothetical protein
MLRDGYGAPCAKAPVADTACASGNAAAAFNNSRRFIGGLSPSGFSWLVERSA